MNDQNELKEKHDRLINKSKEIIKKYSTLDRALTEPEKLLLRKAEIDLDYAEREQDLIESFAGK